MLNLWDNSLHNKFKIKFTFHSGSTPYQSYDWLLYFKNEKKTQKIAAISRWSTFDKEASKIYVLDGPSFSTILDFLVSFAHAHPRPSAPPLCSSRQILSCASRKILRQKLSFVAFITKNYNTMIILNYTYSNHGLCSLLFASLA